MQSVNASVTTSQLLGKALAFAVVFPKKVMASTTACQDMGKRQP